LHFRTVLFALLLPLGAPALALAQAGPPYLSNDPGTPGNGHWEINLAAVPTVGQGYGVYQLPQIDINYGLGDRVQLTYQGAYEVVKTDGEAATSGWGNAFPGIKWRFIDQGEDGWQVSTFPMIETGVSTPAQQRGLGSPGPRYLLSVQAAHKVGPVNVDVDVGWYLPAHGAHERFTGWVVGRDITSRLELDAEIYDDRARDALPRQTTLDVGGRYRLGRGFIALFMAGRSVSGTGAGQPQFLGYFGIQILLKDYGLALEDEPAEPPPERER